MKRLSRKIRGNISRKASIFKDKHSNIAVAESALLSDIEILKRLVSESDDECIFISPLLKPIEQIGPASLDLRLGSELIVMNNIALSEIDLTSLDKELLRRQIEKYSKKIWIKPDEYFVLHPGEFTLAQTLEYIRLPKDIAGRLEGRSSFGRLGLQIHCTAGFIDPQFKGNLTFELINSGRLPLKLRPGIRLGQICFFKVKNVQVGYTDKPFSKYSGTLGVSESKLPDDP